MMTARTAFKVAMQNPEFESIINKFKAANIVQGIPGCVIYAIGGEAFSYSWEEHDGYRHNKMNARRSAYLIRTGQVAFIVK